MAVDDKYLHSELTDKIISLAIKVHRALGPGFPERFYQRALNIEFSKNKVKFSKEKQIAIEYDGEELGFQQLDLVVENKVVLELKVISEINEVAVAQLVSYLKAAGLKIGLVLNFGRNKLEIKRAIV